MSIEIIVPRLGWSMEEGALVAWHKKDGEFVRVGEPLFTIEGDKALQEIEAIDSGVLRLLPGGPNPGDPIRVGEVLGHLVAANETVREALPAAGTKAAVNFPRSQPPAISRATTATTRVPGPSKRHPAISPRALRAAEELAVDWKTVAGTGRTGRIRERDIRAAAQEAARSALD